MGNLENLRKNRDSYSVKLLQFINISAKDPNACVCFFEGEDSKYFAHRIDLLRPDLKWHGIDSGGKENVLKIYEIVTTTDTYRTNLTAFFIDRDFDDDGNYPDGDRLYVTPYYSIENFYVNREVFCSILKHEFKFAEHSEDGEFERCLEAFEKSFANFIDCTDTLNGWAICQRRLERKSPGKAKANLNGLNLSNILKIELESTTGNYSLSDIERSTNASFAVTVDEAEAATKDIPKDSRWMRFRGKFQAFFMRNYLSRLIRELNGGNCHLVPRKVKVPLMLSDRNFISELCQYAITPQCLRLFLNQI